MNDNVKYYIASNFFQYILPVFIITYVFSSGIPSLNTYISVGIGKIHAVSAISITLAFMVASYRVNFISIPWRYLAALSLVILSGHLYDVMWGFFSQLSRGSGMPWVPLFSFILTGCIVVWLNLRLMFLGYTEFSLFLFSLSLLSFLVLSNTGFYQQMILYETAGGTDPSSLCWAVGKLLTLLVFPFFTLWGHEVKEIRWQI